MGIRAAFIRTGIGIQVIRTRRNQIRTLSWFPGQAGGHWGAVFTLAAHIHHAAFLARTTGNTFAGISTLAGGATGIRIQGKTIFTTHPAGEIQAIQILP